MSERREKIPRRWQGYFVDISLNPAEKRNCRNKQRLSLEHNIWKINALRLRIIPRTVWNWPGTEGWESFPSKLYSLGADQFGCKLRLSVQNEKCPECGFWTNPHMIFPTLDLSLILFSQNMAGFNLPFGPWVWSPDNASQILSQTLDAGTWYRLTKQITSRISTA